MKLLFVASESVPFVKTGGLADVVGALAPVLAKEGHDVTGIETSREMLEIANRRRRMPNTAIRFFQMSTIEMTRFLGKGFYNVISCLSDRIIFIHDKTLMRKFFYDCKLLLSEGGHLVLQLSSTILLLSTSLSQRLSQKNSKRPTEPELSQLHW